MLFGQCLVSDSALFMGPLKQKEWANSSEKSQTRPHAALNSTFRLVGSSQLIKVVNISFVSKCEKNFQLVLQVKLSPPKLDVLKS